MPLLRAKPGAIPPVHDACREAPCLACGAAAEMVQEDWDVVDFWVAVQDQVVPLPILEDGAVYLAPRLEGWLAMCDLLGLDQARRRVLIEGATHLHELVHERVKNYMVHLMDPADLRPLEV